MSKTKEEILQQSTKEQQDYGNLSPAQKKLMQEKAKQIVKTVQQQMKSNANVFIDVSGKQIKVPVPTSKFRKFLNIMKEFFGVEPSPTEKTKVLTVKEVEKNIPQVVLESTKETIKFIEGINKTLGVWRNFAEFLNTTIGPNSLSAGIISVIESRAVPKEVLPKETPPLKKHRFESDFPTVVYDISDIVYEGISCTIENIFSVQQLEGQDSPSYQYMGGGNISVQINASTVNPNTVGSVESLFSYVTYLARTYRHQISAGFVDIENKILNLLGVHSFLLSGFDSSTVPMFPFLSKMQIRAVAFDKTQKKKEEIERLGVLVDSSSHSAAKDRMSFVGLQQILKETPTYPDLKLPLRETVINWLNAKIEELKIDTSPGAMDMRKSLEEHVKWFVVNIPLGDVQPRNSQGTDLPLKFMGYADPDFYLHSKVLRRTVNNIPLEDIKSESDTSAPKTIIDLIHEGVKSNIKSGLNKETTESPSNTNLSGSFTNNEPIEGEKEAKDILAESGVDVTTPLEATELITRSVVEKKLEEKLASQNVAKVATIANVAKAIPKKDVEETVLETIVTKGLRQAYEIGNLSASDRSDKIRKLTDVRIPAMAWAIQFYASRTWNEFFSKKAGTTNILNFNTNMNHMFNADSGNARKSIAMSREDFIALCFLLTDFLMNYQDPINLADPFSIGTTNLIISIEKGIDHIMQSLMRVNEALDFAEWDSEKAAIFLSSRKDPENSVTLTQVQGGFFQGIAFLHHKLFEKSIGPVSLAISPSKKPFDPIWDNRMTVSRIYPISSKLEYALLLLGGFSTDKDGKFQTDFKFNKPGLLKRDFRGTFENLPGKKAYSNLHAALREDIIAPLGAHTKRYPSVKIIGNDLPSFVNGHFNNFDPNQSSSSSSTAIIDYFRGLGLMGRDKNKNLSPTTDILSFEGIKTILKHIDLEETIVKPNDLHLSAAVEKAQEEAEKVDIEELTKGKVPGSTFVPLPTQANNNPLTNWRAMAEEAFSEAANKRGRFIRTFPTFYILLIDEGPWVYSMRLADLVYKHSGVVSLDVLRDREMVADTCIIQLSNMYESISSQPPEILDFNEVHWFKYLLDFYFQDDIRNKLDQERTRNTETLFLSAGARLHVRMGYGGTADSLPGMF